MEKETLTFKIGLKGSSDLKQPNFIIELNDKTFVNGSLSVPAGEVEYFEFQANIEEGNNQLKITLLNKAAGDTVQDEQGNIVSDLLLTIDSVEIDEINLGPLLWSASVYNPIYPESYNNEEQKQITDVKNCVDLGWNGTWRLPFTSPFYIWLLENI